MGTRVRRSSTARITYPGILAGLALIAAIAVLDGVWGNDRVIISAVVVGPFVAALASGPWPTAGVAGVAVLACAVSGAWNDNLGSVDWVVRLIITSLGGAFAVIGARSRAHLAIDQVRFRLLRGSAAIGDDGLTIDETVGRLGELLVPALADVCSFDVVRNGGIERLAVVAHGPRAAEIERGLRARAARLAALPSASTIAAMLQGRSALFETDDAWLRARAVDEEDLAFLRRLEGRSTMVVPLRSRGHSIGSLGLIMTSISGRRFDEDTLAFTEVLAGRVALALDNAGLFSEVESLEARQTAALGSLAEAVIIQDASADLVYANQAAAAMMGFSTADAVREAPTTTLFDEYDFWDSQGRRLVREDMPGRRALAGLSAEPVRVRRVHRVTGEERWLLIKASSVAGVGGRPRLAVSVLEDVTDTTRAELVQRMLADVGAALGAPGAEADVLGRVARLVVPELADRCVVRLADERGMLQVVAAVGDEAPPDADADPARRVLADGRPLLLDESSEVLRDQGVRSALVVPMLAGATAIGVLSFVHAASGRSFGEVDLRLADELGRRAGLAVHAARLHRERAETARTLQESLLPDELPVLDGFEAATFYQAAAGDTFVGGDFYDVVLTPGGFAVLIGDVTGHGATAAALTAQARHTLRTAAALLDAPAPAIATLNTALLERRDTSICTAALVAVHPRPEGASARVVCAGHPRPLLVRDGAVQGLGAPGPMIGAWPDARWEATDEELRRGDVLLLYTDGITEAPGREERFGEERLADALRGVTSARQAVDAVRTALASFEATPAAEDDRALIALCVTPVAQAADRPQSS